LSHDVACFLEKAKHGGFLESDGEKRRNFIWIQTMNNWRRKHCENEKKIHIKRFALLVS